MVASLSQPMNVTVLERYHSQDNYYSEGEGLQNSQWRGKYADFQGLQGEIQKDNWMKACNGQDPNGNAIRRQQRGSRAGWDITLSASKSVSLKALVDQDSNILDAHRNAVDATVNYIEENCIHAQIKRKGQVISEQTKQGHFALFEHDDNRNQEPQLHTHVVILNQTLCSDGKSRTLDSRELFNQKKTIGAVYDHALAYHLKKQGYSLNWTSDHTFEIEGYAKYQLEEFSSRRQEIRDYLDRQHIKLEHATEAQKTIACLESRAAKVHKLSPIDHERQHQAWAKLADDLGIEHPQPHHNLEDLYQSSSHPGSITEVINSALESATAQQVAVSKQQLLRECLRYSQGLYEPGAIARAIDQDERLIETSDHRLTTEKILKRERFILKSAHSGQNSVHQLSIKCPLDELVRDRQLNEGQTQALKHLVTSQDKVILIQGDAGVGKTYTLDSFRELLPLETQNTMIGLAPSAAAAQVLQNEAGLSSQTVDRYLFTPTDQLVRDQILIVDEAGMLSHHQMAQLLKKSQDLNNRLILVGDTKQLSSISAGAPFRLLQERSELPTINLNENLRQVTPQLKRAVDYAASQEMLPAFQVLDQQGAIVEIKDEDERLRVIAQKYIERPHERQVQTLVLCDTNQDRQIVTDQIRAAYVEQGKLGQEVITIQTLQPKRLNEQAIAQAYNYGVGDVIRFRSSVPKFPSLYYRVTEVESDGRRPTGGHRLQLKDRQGETVELPIHQYRQREVFRCREIKVREGDRLRFTRNQRDWQQINGQLFTVEGFNSDGTVQINSRGKSYPVTVEQMSHTDYAYCQTVYGAQGWTAKEAIWAPGQRPGQEQTYVALSRAKENLEIVTLDRQVLGLSVQQTQAQENALDLVQEQPQSNHPVQTSLLPGVVNESELKPKPKRQATRKPGVNPEGDRSPAPEHQQTAQAASNPEQPRETTEPVRADRADQPDSGLTELQRLARSFESLAARLDAIDRPTERAGRPNPIAQPGAEPHREASDSDASTECPGDRVERPTEPIEPASARAIESFNTPEPDSDDSQRQAVEREDVSVDVPKRGHSADGDRGADIGDDPELVADARIGSNQRQSEQFGDQSKENAQSVEPEEQRLLAIAQGWSDQRLLEVDEVVTQYFKRRPPEPDLTQGQRYLDRFDKLKAKQKRLQGQLSERRQRVETLGPPRSLMHPFGSPAKEVEAAKFNVSLTQVELKEVAQQMESVKRAFKDWQGPVKRFNEWRNSELGQSMQKAQTMLQMPAVQARLMGIQAAQQRQKVLEALQEWGAIAQKLGKPEAYRQRIREIAEDYRRGMPLSDRAKQAFTKDLEAYQRTQRQGQRRSRGFSR